MSAEFSIARMEESDIDLLFDFRKRVMPENAKQCDRQRWHWLYRQNPAVGPELPVWVIRTPDRIAGAISAVPVPMRLGGGTVTAFFGTDYFVEEAFQGLPALRLLKTLQANNPIHIGANLSKSAVRLFTKIGYVDLGECLYVASACISQGEIKSTLSHIKHLIRSSVRSVAQLGWYGQEVLDTLPDDYETLWHRIRLKDPTGIEKDATYMRWKYQECPSIDCQFIALSRHSCLRGIAVVTVRPGIKDRGHTGVLLDLLVEPGDDLGLMALVGSCLDFFSSMNCDNSFLHWNAVWARPLLSIMGFNLKKSDLGLMVWVNPESQALRKLLKPDWFVSLGDTDRY